MVRSQKNLQKNRSRSTWSVLQYLGELWQKFVCETEAQEVLFPDCKDRNLSPHFALEAYKDLSELEWFLRLTTIFEGRPFWLLRAETEVIEALRAVMLYELEVEGEKQRFVPRPRAQGARVPKALGIQSINPSNPPQASPTRHM